MYFILLYHCNTIPAIHNYSDVRVQLVMFVWILANEAFLKVVHKYFSCHVPVSYAYCKYRRRTYGRHNLIYPLRLYANSVYVPVQHQSWPVYAHAVLRISRTDTAYLACLASETDALLQPMQRGSCGRCQANLGWLPWMSSKPWWLPQHNIAPPTHQAT